MSVNINYYATYVELQDIPSYSTNITVEGQLLKLSFLWNERIGKRVLSIKNSSDVVYLQNTILHPNEPLELNSNAVLDDLPYSVTLVKTGDVNKVGNIFNWSKDFILCFSRTVDLDVKKLNVVYGVTTPSTPILPPPTHVFEDWILNQGFTILGDDIRYTGYKTNGVDTYDSFADFDLVTALIRSFHDEGMQQWQGFEGAVNELTGVTDWVVDTSNEQIIFINNENLPPQIQPYDQYFYVYSPEYNNPSSYWARRTAEASCKAIADWTQTDANEDYLAYKYTHLVDGYYETEPPPISGACKGTAYNKNSGENYGAYEWDVYRKENPNYDPAAQIEKQTISFDSVAHKIISNLQSSNEGTSLLAEAYIEASANSIFDNNPSKQFVKLEDLIPQLETNKVIR